MSDDDSDFELALALSLSLTESNSKRRSARLKEKTKNGEVEQRVQSEEEKSDGDPLFQHAIELSKKEAEKSHERVQISQRETVIHHLATDEIHYGISWATMKEYTELYGTPYDGFLVLPPHTIIKSPKQTNDADSRLHIQLQNEVLSQYVMWASPRLDTPKWYRRASKKLKEIMKHHGERERSHYCELPKAIETKLLSERRMLFCAWADAWYPGVSDAVDLSISWDRFKRCMRHKKIADEDVHDIFIWYASDEDLHRPDANFGEDEVSLGTLLHKVRAPIGTNTICIARSQDRRRVADMQLGGKKKRKMEIDLICKSTMGIGAMEITWERFCRMFDDMALILEENGTLHH